MRAIARQRVGRLVFDGTAAQLNDKVVRDLYGMESDEAGVDASAEASAGPAQTEATRETA